MKLVHNRYVIDGLDAVELVKNTGHPFTFIRAPV
jgi:hypothetical protein